MTEKLQVVDLKSVPMARWGKDHWSMLAYIETLCVDGKNGVGQIDRRRVRCNYGRRGEFPAILGLGGWKPTYGTKLKGYFDTRWVDHAAAAGAGCLLSDHDDWDCLADLYAAGLVHTYSRSNGFVQLTSQGAQMAARVRAHKAAGGQLSNFELGEDSGEALRPRDGR